MTRGPAVVGPVRTFFEHLGPTPTDMVVAVSGGADSVALLRVLADLIPGRLVVAHLNHCLRGPDSDADEAFVGRLVESLRSSVRSLLSFRTDRRDVAAAGDNLEAKGRRVRYDWLSDVAKSDGIAWVATGHTADDQAETVLFRLLRGTGLAGLTGIAPRRLLAPGVKLLRPLLNVRRMEVLAYLRTIGQDYRDDASNADLRYSRNRIRHELLPLLAERYNPRVREVLCQLAEQASDARDQIEEAVVKLIRSAERPRAGPLVVLDLTALSGVSRPQLRALWRNVWEREGWPRQSMGFKEWDRLAELCHGNPDAIELPGHIRARRRGEVMQVGPVS
jgi:tRNA(Ile)-lysidine synthase